MLAINKGWQGPLGCDEETADLLWLVEEVEDQMVIDDSVYLLIKFFKGGKSMWLGQWTVQVLNSKLKANMSID